MTTVCCHCDAAPGHLILRTVILHCHKMQNQPTCIKSEAEVLFSGIFLCFCFARISHTCPPEEAGAGQLSAVSILNLLQKWKGCDCPGPSCRHKKPEASSSPAWFYFPQPSWNTETGSLCLSPNPSPATAESVHNPFWRVPQLLGQTITLEVVKPSHCLCQINLPRGLLKSSANVSSEGPGR